jgi:hypothetical protein
MGDSEPKRRWFHPTPGWLLLVLLLTTSFLCLADHYQWFEFNQIREFSGLLIFASIGFVLYLILLWFLISLWLRFRFQFTIRSL